MGYRSEVFIAVALPTIPVLSELVSVYALDPRVQRCKTVDDWLLRHQDFSEYYSHKNGGSFYTMTYHNDHTKWYEAYEDVEAFMHLGKLCSTFAEERGEMFSYAYRFCRIGEEHGDIEVDSHESEDGLGQAMSDELSDLAYPVQMLEITDRGTQCNLTITPNGGLQIQRGE